MAPQHQPGRRQHTKAADRVLRISGELRNPPDLRVLAEALIDLATDSVDEPDND